MYILGMYLCNIKCTCTVHVHTCMRDVYVLMLIQSVHIQYMYILGMYLCNIKCTCTYKGCNIKYTCTYTCKGCTYEI